MRKEKGTESEETWRKKTRRKRLACVVEAAVLDGEAVARAKVGSEGGVEGGGGETGGSGIRDRFLKDASRGTCCAARWRARRKSAARAVKRNDHRGAARGTYRGCGKDSRGGESGRRSEEGNEYESN